ncbi:MAG: sugar phosphate isomerase/epimerase, partial [Sediminibacterium sp.]
MSLDRRKFLSTAATLGALAMTPFEELLASKPAFKVPADFSLKIMGTNWGFPGTMDAFCAKAKKAGYDGVELWWPGTEAAQREMLDALKKHQLEVGFLAGGSDQNHVKHFEQFKIMFDG